MLEEIVSTKQRPPYGAISIGYFNKDTFHRAIGPVLACGQFFGLMPVSGVLGKDPTCLKFKWLTWRMCYSLFILASITLLGLACLFRSIDAGFTFGGVQFYGSAFLTHVAFLRLAPYWPRLSVAIAKEEVKRVPRQSKHRPLLMKFCVYSFFVLFFALVEHLLSIASGISVVYECSKHLPTDYKFYTSSFPQIFSYTSYAKWKGAFAQITNLAATFHWSMKDLFIILVSVELTNRLEQINNSLNVTIGKNFPEQFWRVTRCEYVHLATLVAKVDRAVNEIILLSFANNLYSICVQLFNTLNTKVERTTPSIPCWKLADGGLSNAIYFIFSFGFLFIRFLAVSLAASRIHSASRKPLKALYSVPPESYCNEVKRFLDQVTTDMVGLTGLNFFYITRGLILTIAGTVVTYELVLLQFNSPAPKLSANITLNDTCGLGFKKNVTI